MTEKIINDVKRPYRGDLIISILGIVLGALTLTSILF